ncbi:Uncharacterised protein [uncultured archaeon]|nr:Uncharacterised protein [uncultured archaeon]
MKDNDVKTSIPIFSDLKKVIDEVGEDRFLALIAHHEPDQFYKTIQFRIFKKSVRLCTRCTGIYLGIIATIILFLFTINIPHIFQLVIIFVFPIPAMLDWGLDKYNLRKGSNTTRFVSGFMLGICYIFLWARFIRNPLDVVVWSVAVVYSAIAGVILYTHKKIM